MGKTFHKDGICEACPENIMIKRKHINYYDLQTIVLLKLHRYTDAKILKIDNESEKIIFPHLIVSHLMIV